MKLEDFDLKQDPFPIVPDGPVHNWASRDELRLDLEDIVKGVRARDIGITEFAVLHGEYGAGKSHALRYLRTMISESQQDFDSLAVYVERPRVASKLNFLEIHKYIVKIIGREKVNFYGEKLWNYVEEISEALVIAANMQGIHDKSSFYEKAMLQFAPDDRNMIKLMFRCHEKEGSLFEFLCGATKCDGDEYEGRIESDFLAAKILSDFLRVLTLDIGNGRRVLESVYLFIDECEVLAEARTSESELVFNGLRELINGLPYRFGLFLSFSAGTALIEAIMPQHLLKRLTHSYIEIPILGDEEALDFLRTQINFFRPELSSHQGTFYPFTEEAIKYIITNTNTMTPRNLFIDCRAPRKMCFPDAGVMRFYWPSAKGSVGDGPDGFL